MKHSIRISLQGDEVVIEANRDGLRRIAKIAEHLATLSDVEAKTPANHFHISKDMNTAEPGSLSMVIVLKET